MESKGIRRDAISMGKRKHTPQHRSWLIHPPASPSRPTSTTRAPFRWTWRACPTFRPPRPGPGPGRCGSRSARSSLVSTRAQLTWPSMGKSTRTATIPRSLRDGEDLLRIEHIALHGASTAGDAQFIFRVAQTALNGGGDVAGGVASPGTYSATDPGILIDINYPIPTSYVNRAPRLSPAERCRRARGGMKHAVEF